jgi:4a-hydroxytetrahydrobiopterin dehydratase
MHNNWLLENKEQVKTFYLTDYKVVMDFVNKVMHIADNQNHHPTIEVHYKFVKVSITDHDLGRVSEKCLKFMEAVDKIQIQGKI